MNTMNDLYRQRRGASLADCPPLPPRCSSCGTLECLCRPRFFAGQVLTADDLNRLDHYMRGKNRLHNRQLHGWGVVNGLEVTCNPCGDGVAVGCGYALSPCGDDIVVCESVAVDVCALIERCRQAENPWNECAPFQYAKPHQCQAGEEEWILAIRYAEAPSRGVKPLRPGQAYQCMDGCSCGGAGSTSCSCGGSKFRPRGAPVQCEPTVVCEGFAFEVYRKPPDTDPGSERSALALNNDSELMQRFQCCWGLLKWPQVPGALDAAAVAANLPAWVQWLRAFYQQLQRYFASHGAYHCELQRRFALLLLPGANATGGQVFLANVQLLIIWLDALLECLCSALLSPCPAPTQETRVPLAVLHVDAAACKVIRICNWSVHRKIATTFPALQYWLALLPFGKALRQGLQSLCCFDVAAWLPELPAVQGSPAAGGQVGEAVGDAYNMIGQPVEMVAPSQSASAGHTGTGAEAAGEQDPDVLQARLLLQQVNRRLNPDVASSQGPQAAADLLFGALLRSDQGLGLEALAAGLLGGKNIEGPALSETERANLPQVLLANQARALVSPALGPLVGMMGGTLLHRNASVAPSSGGSNDELRAELAALRAEVDALKARGSAGTGEPL